MGGMEIRSAAAGAFATVVVAGLVFTAVAVSNAQEAAPVADQQATIATLTARLDAAEDTLASHESRLTDAESVIMAHGLVLSGLSTRVLALEYP